MSAPVSGKTRSPQAFTASKGYQRYVLGILLLVSILSFVDRQLFAILLEPIKAEFGLSDTQLGLVSGLAFSMFYVTVGIPVAWLADRMNRRNIIAVALGTWSLMTALCGLAGSFSMLFMARMGVGVGEAGGAPPSHSLIADYFRPDQRATALSIFGLGLPVGLFVSFAGGGLLAETLGWRSAFLIFGIPGVLLAIVIRLTLREPPRGYSENLQVGQTEPLMTALNRLWERRTFRHLPTAFALFTLAGWGAMTWMPSYFIRMHGLSPADIGIALALIVGLGGGTGTLIGGALADRLARKYDDARWYMWLSASAAGLSIPFSMAAFLSGDTKTALVCLLFWAILSQSFMGPTYAIVQGIAGLPRRALASSVLLFLTNLVSYGLGALVIGILSDVFNPAYGVESLRYSLLALLLIFPAWSVLHFLLAAGPIRADLEAAAQESLQ